VNSISVREDAFTGLEAAIVLIAFVITATAFAYVILGAGFFTTQKSQEVVHTSVESASSTVQLAGELYGISTDSETVTMLNFTVMLAPGSDAIDFGRVAVTYSNETILETLEPVTGLRSTSTTAGTWAITKVSSETGPSNNLLEYGEQFTISAHPTIGTPKNTILSIEIKPAVGSAITIRRTVPGAVGIVNTLS
jgi:archaeal flagellin FlaB